MKKRFSTFSALVLLSLVLALTSSAQSIKPGTEIRVQLLSSLDTGKTQSGQEFAATLADPVQMDNGALWPKGTEIKGKIVEVVSSGRLSRPASISLQLTQIGKSPIQTETAKLDGQSHGARNTALIGGIAAVGAVLGGIANGGKGALIGAAAGATAGTAAAAATGKQEIVLPAETFVTFVVAGPGDVQITQIAPPAPAPVAAPIEAAQEQAPPSDPYAYEPYTPEQLDNLVAPVALYPDPLLAQLLLAATFPDQIDDAAPWARMHNPNDIDYQPWDISVRAVAHYPAVLSMLDDRLDWTTALGQAYIYQSTDVMQSVQHLRYLAYSQGNLVSTPQQQVLLDRGIIAIVPAQPRMIYAPVYDPGVIYVRHVYRPGYGFGGFYDFGPGFVIGAWLNYDMDWGGRRVVYQDWSAPRDGWRARSRPYVQVTNVYVNNRYETVRVNQTVMDRHVNYENVERYNSVHHDVSYENHARFEANRAHQEPSRPAPQGWNGRGNEREATNQPRPVEQRPEFPRPTDASLRRANPEPPRTEPIQAQPTNQNDRDRGSQNRGWQIQQNEPQPTRPSDASNNRGNQAAPAGEPARSQPSELRGDDRRNDRNVQPQRQEPPATPAPAVAPSLPPQAENRNDRGNNRGFRNDGPPERPAPPVQVAAPQLPAQVENRNERANERGLRNGPPERQEPPAAPARAVTAQPQQPAAPVAAVAAAPAVERSNAQRSQQNEQPQQAHDNGNHKDNGNHGNGNRGKNDENVKDKK
jgi:hypothetical protein